MPMGGERRREERAGCIGSCGVRATYQSRRVVEMKVRDEQEVDLAGVHLVNIRQRGDACSHNFDVCW
jgi:hypothetical protein